MYKHDIKAMICMAATECETNMGEQHHNVVRVAVMDPQQSAALLPYVQRFGHPAQEDSLLRILSGEINEVNVWLPPDYGREWVTAFIRTSWADGETLPPYCPEPAIASTSTLTDLPIEALGFTPLTYNTLKRDGIDIIGELTNKTEADLLRLGPQHSAQKRLDEIKFQLAAVSLKLRDAEDTVVSSQGAVWPEQINPLELPIEELDLTMRAYNGLKRKGISTIAELVGYTEADLLDIRDFGARSLDDVKMKLAAVTKERTGAELTLKQPEKASGNAKAM